MKFSQLISDQSLPALLSPVCDSDRSHKSFLRWTEESRPLIDEKIHQARVLLVCDFEVNDPEKFKQASAAIRPDLRKYTEGDSPQRNVTDKVYTSTEYSAHLKVLLHNELSYAGLVPGSGIFLLSGCSTEWWRNHHCRWTKSLWRNEFACSVKV